MSRRPATIVQADIARIIRAAKQAGATKVGIPVNGETVIVYLESDADKPLASKREIVL